MRQGAIALTVAVMLAIPAMPVKAGPVEDPVIAWNRIMVATIAGQNPFAQARLAAITQLAVFEAVNAITHDHDPYVGVISAPAGASPEAAAVAAAHAVLVNYVPAAAATLDAARVASLATIGAGPSKDDGLAVGLAAATELITLRTGDGSAPPQFYSPTSSAVGEWQATATCPTAGGILFHWRNLAPFGVQSNEQFRAAPPPPVTSSEYTRSYEEVARVGGVASLARPADRADAARLYNALSAVGAWNGAAEQLAAATPLSLSEHARVLALLNMSMSDALATSMETKYHYRAWRPETAIRGGDADGNNRTAGDAGFAPFIPTPCFPGYPSAHASASYAGRAILERAFGGGGHSIDVGHPSLPGIVVHYTSLKAMTDDIDDARVYGGIHFRFDQDAGAKQGLKVGQYVFAHYLGVRP
jgi:hypothetical protein